MILIKCSYKVGKYTICHVMLLINHSFISQTQIIIVDQSNNFFVGVCVGGAAGGF